MGQSIVKTSAGLLVYRFNNSQLEVLIVHPGGPYFMKKDKDVWSIPKGLVEEGEDPMDAAKREFKEELGFEPPRGEFKELGEVKYPKSSKKVLAWAVEGDLNPAKIKSNTFEAEWPPRSGKKQQFPEVDRAEWHSLPSASEKLFSPNVIFLERLARVLGVSFNTPDRLGKQLGLL